MASVYNVYQTSSLGMMENSNTNNDNAASNKVSVDANGRYVANPSHFGQISNGYAATNAGNYYPSQASSYSYQPAAGTVDYSFTYNNAAAYYGQQSLQQQHQVQQPQVNGGVASVLDYDLDVMSKFTTYLAFRLFDRKDTNNTQFINSLKTVLSSVRLPLSSLILSNYFLLERFELDSSLFQSHSNNLEKIYESVVISLILANKANDDNTFTNKSWSCATGLSIQIINKTEVEWLVMMGYHLHNTKMERYDELMLQFEKYTTSIKTHEMEQLRLMEAKAQQLQAQAQAVQQSISPTSYYDQRSSIPVGNYGQSYGYSNARESHHKQSSLSIGNGYSRENYYSHRKNYSIDQSSTIPVSVSSQYYGQPPQTVPTSVSSSASTTSPYYNSYCLKSGSYQIDAYCSCSYCLASSSNAASTYSATNVYASTGAHATGSGLNWRQHYYTNANNISC